MRSAPRPSTLCIALCLSLLLVGSAVAGPLATPRPAAVDAPALQQQQQNTPVFAPSVFRDIGGQVAVEDGEVTVRGTATGLDEVLVSMIDRRGRIASAIVSVDDDDVFDEDVTLATPDGTQLAEGPIVASVFSAGRDGVVGDGEIAGFTRADLAALDENTRERARETVANRSVTRTQAQVLELFYEESINDTGSDDLVLIDAFRFTDGRTSVEAVLPVTASNGTDGRNATDETTPVANATDETTAVANDTDETTPVANVTNETATDRNDTTAVVTDEMATVTAGETMLVRGRTNRKPDDNTITVEAVDGPTTEALDIVSTDQWGLDGIWQVRLDTDGAEPGVYTLEADDGDDSDRIDVRIVPAENGTVTPAENGTATPAENGTATSTAD